MKRLPIRALVLAMTGFTGLANWGEASATVVMPENIICPVGGEEFKTYAIMSHTSWGQRPDGRPYGTLPIIPLPECPANRFVIFDDDFSSAEIARLTQLVEGKEYQSISQHEAPYYCAWWLAAAIGRPVSEQAMLLLQAGWQMDGDAARKRGYQSRFVDLVAGLALVASDEGPNFWLRLREVNALRELGRFEEAGERLKAFLDPALWPGDRDELTGLAVFLQGETLLIADRNPASEPANMLPDQIAKQRCAASEEFHGVEALACARLAGADDARIDEEVETVPIDLMGEEMDAAEETAQAASEAIDGL